MKVLKWLLMALATLSLAAAIARFVTAAVMPDEPKFVNELDIDAPAEKVWEVMTDDLDTRRYAEWQTQLDRVEIIDNSTWIEYPKLEPDPVRFRLVTDERPIGMKN